MAPSYGYSFAECACHVWVVSAVGSVPRCRLCRTRPVRVPYRSPLRTVCKHDGPCRPREVSG